MESVGEWGEGYIYFWKIKETDISFSKMTLQLLPLRIQHLQMGASGIAFLGLCWQRDDLWKHQSSHGSMKSSHKSVIPH